MDVCALREQQLIGQDGLQRRPFGVRLCPQSLTGPGFGQAGNSADRPRVGCVNGFVFGSGVMAELVCLLCAALPFFGKGQGRFRLQAAAGDLHPSQAGPLTVTGNFEHLGPKVRAVGRYRGVVCQALQQGIHPLQLEGGAEIAGEQLAAADGTSDVLPSQLFCLQILLQEGLVADSSILSQRLGKINTTVSKACFQLPQDSVPVSPGQVHLVDKEKSGDVIALQ